MAKYILFFFGLLFIVSCDDSWIKKPEGLIHEKKMVDMLVDMHVANSMFLSQDLSQGSTQNLKSEDYYYSVLKKYSVADTVFEKSIIYYSNFPKDFEKIYAAVLDKTVVIQEEYKGKIPDAVDVGN